MNNNELMHFGIRGMQWGIRRYRNSDGSLTDAGRKRYSSAKIIASRVKQQWYGWKESKYRNKLQNGNDSDKVKRKWTSYAHKHAEASEVARHKIPIESAYDNAKRNLKIGKKIVVTALAAYGAYSIYQAAKGNKDAVGLVKNLYHESIPNAFRTAKNIAPSVAKTATRSAVRTGRFLKENVPPAVRKWRTDTGANLRKAADFISPPTKSGSGYSRPRKSNRPTINVVRSVRGEGNKNTKNILTPNPKTTPNLKFNDGSKAVDNNKLLAGLRNLTNAANETRNAVEGTGRKKKKT